MTDDEWKAFAKDHAGRIPLGWPDGRGAFWRTFRESLEEARVTAAEAEAVSRSLFKRPPEFNTVPNHAGHFFARLAEIRRGLTASQSEPGRALDPSDLERQEAWDRLPATEQDSRLRAMAERFPGLRRWRGMLLVLCQDELLGEFDHAEAPDWWRRPWGEQLRERQRREIQESPVFISRPLTPAEQARARELAAQAERLGLNRTPPAPHPSEDVPS